MIVSALLEHGVVGDPVDAREVVRAHAELLRDVGELLLALARVLGADAAGAGLGEVEVLVGAARDDDECVSSRSATWCASASKSGVDPRLEHHPRVELASSSSPFHVSELGDVVTSSALATLVSVSPPTTR